MRIESPFWVEPEDAYVPKGLCATGCGHAATHIWPLYRGSNLFEHRCGCCVIKGQLERAQRAAERIPKLQAEYAKAVTECDGK